MTLLCGCQIFAQARVLAHKSTKDITDEFDFCLIDSQAPGLQSDGIDARPGLSSGGVLFVSPS